MIKIKLNIYLAGLVYTLNIPIFFFKLHLKYNAIVI